MADRDDWTADDDDRLRAALTSLRTDVEAAPLPDVRFVKARGTARRRQRMLTWTAAAAVAAVVVGTVGYSQLSSDRPGHQTPPAGRAGTTSAAPSPTTADSLDIPALLPIASEWQRSLGLPAGSLTVTPVTKGGGVECGDALGKPTRQESVVQANSPVSGAATFWRFEGPADRQDQVKALERGVAKCQAGPGFKVTPALDADVSVYSYSTPDAGSGWFAVASGGAGAALLQLVDPAFNDVSLGGFTEDEMAALARIAAKRLGRYATAPATPSSSKSAQATDGAKAIDEKMPVTGPGSVPSWKLFVAASQWSSEALTGGARTNAGPGALEGSTAIASCESDEQQAGIGGQVGVVSVRTGTGTASYLGHQRVQLDEATAPAVQKAYVTARLTEAKALYAKGCTLGNGTVKSTKGPTEGTYRLDTVFGDGTPTLSQWVGVTAQKTPGAVSTIVLTRVTDRDQGFAELDRLLALARQK